MGSIRKLAVVVALAASVVAGFVLAGDGEARGGMSSSALTGVMYTWGDPGNLIVSFKVIDANSGNIVWQSTPADLQVVDYGVALVWNVAVDEAFRPDDPRYEWVMVTNAVRAQDGVYWTQFTFTDIFDADHIADDVPGLVNVQGRILEAHVTIQD